MKLKIDTDYDVDILKKINIETASYEPGKKAFDMIIDRYFVGDF
jgi:hypothetical protein